MENSIQIFEHDINNSDNTATYYVSDAAITYFFEIRSVLDDIAGDLAALETESVAPLTPGCLQLQMELLNNINIVERILKSANKHDAKSSDRLIGVRDLLVKFDYIKKLMLHGNREFRQDAMGLFIRTGNLYQISEIREFINLLNEDELKYIMQIVHQEETLLEKTITNTPIHMLAIQRINQINALRSTNRDEDDER